MNIRTLIRKLNEIDSKDKTIFFKEKGNPHRLGGIVSAEYSTYNFVKLNVGKGDFSTFYIFGKDAIKPLKTIDNLMDLIKKSLSSEGYNRWMDSIDMDMIDELEQIAHNHNAHCKFINHDYSDSTIYNVMFIDKFDINLLRDIFFIQENFEKIHNRIYRIESNDIWGKIMILFKM